MNDIIKLEQTPKILHKLQEVGENVTARINELNIEKQVATEDTIKSLKSLRAELNKEARRFEDQRKFVKDAILKPYGEFEDVYKEEIINKYKSADDLLKSKINDFEMNIKSERRNNLISYFKEICEVEKIDWIEFDRLGIEINLSTSEKKYKEQISEVIEKIVSDLDLIKTDEYSAEILVEYKKTLNASKSIQEVRSRKESEKQEKIRIQAERAQKRISQLHSLAFTYSDLTKTYNNAINESIMVSMLDIETLSNEEWMKVYAELEIISKLVPKSETAKTLEAPKEMHPAELAKQEEAKPAKIFKAAFEIVDTHDRLREVQNFLKSNNYNYKNI